MTALSAEQWLSAQILTDEENFVIETDLRRLEQTGAPTVRSAAQDISDLVRPLSCV